MPRTTIVDLTPDQIRLLLTMGVARRIRRYVVADVDQIADVVVTRVLSDLAEIGVALTATLIAEVVAEVSIEVDAEVSTDA